MIAEPVPVDGDFVPRARAVPSVLVGGEAILHHAGSIHHLNPTATIVWQCCDGEATVDTLAAELAGAFGVEVDTARTGVLTTVAELAAAGLLRAADGVDDVLADPLAVLVDPDEACGSCAQRPWADNVTIAVGATAVPVAIGDAETGAALERALAAHLLRDVGPFSPYYALVVPSRTPAPGRRGLYALHRGEAVVVQTRRPARLLRALLAHLAPHGDLAGLGLAAVPALVVAAGGRALLLPVPERPVAFGRALARHGVAAADAPAALVDPVRAEVVVGAPGLEVDLDVLDAAAARLPALGDEPAPLRWGRYPVAGVAAPGGTRGRALLALSPPNDPGAAAAVDALVHLLDRVPVFDALDPAGVAARLAGEAR
jgi:hypothetical protein